VEGWISILSLLIPRIDEQDVKMISL
jgi:hypothetical protein